MSLSQKYFNFNRVGEFDIEKIKREVDSFTKEDWRKDENFFRFSNVFDNTQSYFIYQSDINWEKQTPFTSTLSTNNNKIIEFVDPIIEILEKIHQGKRGQVFLFKIIGNKKFDDHQDLGVYLSCARRNYIPIQINNGIRFVVSGQQLTMREGDCWEINNNQLHSIDNKNNTDSYYLVVDVMPNKEIEKI